LYLSLYLHTSARTPLHTAIERAEDYNVSRILIENGADLNNRNIDGKTPLHTFFNSVVRKILLHYGDEIDGAIADNQGMTLLHFVAWSSKSSVECFKRCLQHCGATALWLSDCDNRSALHLAAQRGNADIVQYILGHSPQVVVTLKDKRGRSIFHYAADSKRTSVIDIVHFHGGSIHALDENGHSALHYAVLRGNLAAAEKLTELGAANNIYLKDREDIAIAGFTSQPGATTAVSHPIQRKGKVAPKEINIGVRTAPLGSPFYGRMGTSWSSSFREFLVVKPKLFRATSTPIVAILVAALMWLCMWISVWSRFGNIEKSCRSSFGNNV